MGEKSPEVQVSKDEAEVLQKQKELTSKDYYFDSYAHFGIHEEMLKDEMRTKTYMNAIIQNKHLFKDKVVLDVGCGTGILSMFAAQAGAKTVFGVDCSTIADQAKTIVEVNGLSDKVKIIQGKIEEVVLPVDKVDIIISEWMGYFLLYESMLDSVLFARDKWLTPDGLIFPDKASMYICGLEDGEYKEENIHFWDRVYGFDMSCIKKMALMEPLVETVDFEQVMSNCSKFASFDIKTMEKDSVDFDFPFEIKAKRNDYCHALVVYFDVEFGACHKHTAFSTGPQDPYTHWKQSIMYLQEDLTCNTGDVISGNIKCTRNKKNIRDLDILLDYKMEGEVCKVDRKQDFYRMR